MHLAVQLQSSIQVNSVLVLYSEKQSHMAAHIDIDAHNKNPGWFAKPHWLA